MKQIVSKIEGPKISKQSAEMDVEIRISEHQGSNASAFIKLLDSTGSAYYETIQLADIDGDGKAELIERLPEGLEAWKYDPSVNAWKFLHSFDDLRDQAGWNQPQYSETIQLADIDGDGKAELIARGYNGVHAWNYNPSNRKWDLLSILSDMSDDRGWDRPECYKTIQLADIDGDGKAELIGRDHDGLKAWKYDPINKAWHYLALLSDMSDAAGWNQPRYYETIQCASITSDPKAELIARSMQGLEAWMYDPHDNVWIHLEKTYREMGDAAGWNLPQYYKTIQFADIDGDGKAELIARSMHGLDALEYNPKTKQWDRLASLSEMSDAAGWNKPQYYETIQCASITSEHKADLIARSTHGLAAFEYNPKTKEWHALASLGEMSDAAGWNKPQYYKTIKFADIDGDGKAELIALYTDMIWAFR